MNKLFNIFSEVTFGEITDLDSMEFEILSSGKKAYRGSVINITENDLNEMVANFNNNIVGTQLAVDINHDPEHKAFAWFASLRCKGGKLLAKFKDYTEEGRKLISEGSFKYFSVEFDNAFERVIDGSKKTFKNVLRGVALTNRPVDKEIAPTFFSENLSTNIYTMNLFNKYAKELKAKKIVLAEEKALLNIAFEELDDEAKAEAEEIKEEIDAKPEAEEAKTEDPPADPDKGALSEKKVTELSEEMKSLKEENVGFRNKIRFAEIEKETSKEILLSETNETGLSKKHTDELNAFLLTFSEENADKIIGFLKNVKHVDFSERGGAGEGEDGDVSKQAQVEKLAKTKLAEAEKANKKMTLGEATMEVLDENPELNVFDD